MKWKTALQMIALPALMVGDAAPAWIPAAVGGEVLLWAAAALTVVTGYDYLKAGVHHMADGAVAKSR